MADYSHVAILIPCLNEERTVAKVVRDHRSALPGAAGTPPVLDFLRFRYVYRVPLAILASGLAIVAVMSLGIGLVIDSACRYYRESFEMLRKLLYRAPGSVGAPHLSASPATSREARS